ncbi:unnamed protein product [marine sediment metagenome]|uniref:Uncharacterized protein n=1 Tax=marine sediment metagenome TaxID=412755 RepID=X1CSJ8_9ZZZZ
MNETQDKALVSLSKAFAKCKKASLAFQGMDDNLLAFDADEYNRLTEKVSICEQQYVCDDNGYFAGNQGVGVDTHNCYRDSGGW